MQTIIEQLPFELLEKVVHFSDIRSFLNLKKVDNRVKHIKYVVNIIGDDWLVTFPETIDWTSPSAPKNYVDYDKNDFTIHHKGKQYRRSDNIRFITVCKGHNISFVSPQITLDVSNLYIEDDFNDKSGALVLGKSKLDIDRELIMRALSNWSTTIKKPKIPTPHRCRGFSGRRRGRNTVDYGDDYGISEDDFEYDLF
jgi:hypothetical protein